MDDNGLQGRRVLVMGLGLHGGGVETARYLVRSGARVTCTDLRSEADLAPSLEALGDLDVRYVLGEHRQRDFDAADLIVKNPAVPSDSPWIAGRTNVETDISLFLRSCESPLIAVTGSKGKSTVVTALHHLMRRWAPGVRLGGNITVSPLSFLDRLDAGDPVILELSSWQLADLRGRGLLHPRVCSITNLMHDHQNRYASFADYEADKRIIFEHDTPGGLAVFPDDDFGTRWAASFPGESILVSAEGPPTLADPRIPRAWIDREGRGLYRGGSGDEELVPERLGVPGAPFRLNALFAAVIARRSGGDAATIRDALGDFAGVPYRMELFLEDGGLRFYDDTAATIPDAAAAGVRAMDRPVILIAGGTDKDLDFAPFRSAARIPKRIVMLPGSATDLWMPLLRRDGASVEGPAKDMDDAVRRALAAAEPGDAVLLSPGAASFGLFRHEFQRGDAFKEACRAQIR